MNFLKYFTKSLLGFLYPPKPRVLILESLSTNELLKKLPPATGPEQGDIVALFDYTHPLVKEIIWQVKYSGNRLLAEKLGGILFDTIIQELDERSVLPKERSALLIPMPISGKRRFERGWNQAELLAKAIKDCDTSKYFKYTPGQLVKVIHTESQTRTAGKRERAHNLENSMKVLNPAAIEDRFVILIDDVVTTGSTFAEAKRALKAAGAKKILCIAIAH